MSTSATYTSQRRSIEAQQVAAFTGEGAYHGSTKPREPSPTAAPPTQAPAPAHVPDKVPDEVAEMSPTTLAQYAAEGRTEVEVFNATFPNGFEVVDALPVPTQAEIMAEEVTFCWCPFAEAQRLAGPLTAQVLAAIQPHLTGRKRYVYVDSKVQHFEAGDLPVDSALWHVDGSITARDARAQRLGFGVVHDMQARVAGGAEPPIYWAYQSSLRCATQYVEGPLTVQIPALIGRFDGLDAAVRAANPRTLSQPAGAVVRFDGLTLHRAVQATGAGWRLWVRCVETDREARLNPAVVACYGTVFRPVGTQDAQQGVS